MAIKRIPTILAVAALSIGLAACGSSSGLSRSEIGGKASKLCSDADRQLKALPQPGNVQQDARAAAAYLDKAVPSADNLLAGLKKLKPASSVKADWDAFVAQQSAATVLLDSARKKAHANDASGVNDLKQLATLNQQKVKPAAAKVDAAACA